VWLFSSVETARAARANEADRPLLAGEVRALRPEGFDLGNSPDEFVADRVSGRRIFMATTNGTRAILACAAAGAQHVWAGALVNAAAVAKRLAAASRPVTLVCSGTVGRVSLEDMLGAGAVMAETGKIVSVEAGNDSAVIAAEVFGAMRGDLAGALRRGQGGKNVHAAHLDPDVEFAANLNSIDTVGAARGTPWVVRKAE
jgi:2-phosphosulfolactate phosphatase